MLIFGTGYESYRRWSSMDAVMFNGENECEIAAMLLRQCSDEWVAHALFDAMDFVVGRVYYVDEDVV